MKKIISESDLREAILQLEIEQTDQGKLLKDNFFQAIDSVRPINLIKNTFREAVGSGDLKSDILNTSVGLTAGLLSKIIFTGVMKAPLAKLLGTAVMFGVTKIVAKNPETVKTLGKGLINLIRGKRSGEGSGDQIDENTEDAFNKFYP